MHKHLTNYRVSNYADNSRNHADPVSTTQLVLPQVGH